MAQNSLQAAEAELMFDPSLMIAAIRKISKILSEEVVLLEDMKISEIHKFYNDKIELAALLESYKAMLQQYPELLNSIPANTRAELLKEATKFEGLVEEDNKQISRERKSTSW